MIIGIAGPTASGKTTIAKILAERNGAFRIKYSDILAELAQERGLDGTDKATLQNLFLTERVQRGEDFVTRELELRVLAMDKPLIVIEGNRRLVDIDTLKRIAQEKHEKLLLLFIEAPKQIRFIRYNKRLLEHGEEAVTAEAFETLETNDAEDELDGLRQIFENEGHVIDVGALTPEEIYARIKPYLEQQ